MFITVEHAFKIIVCWKSIQHIDTIDALKLNGYLQN